MFIYIRIVLSVAESENGLGTERACNVAGLAPEIDINKREILPLYNLGSLRSH